MDLSIGDYVELDSNESIVIDPYVQASIDRAFYRRALPLSVPGRTRFLAFTIEEVEVPAGMVGLIGLRSTWARLGLTAPLTIADPEFRGHLTLEGYNANTAALKIREGDSIWSIIFLKAPFEPPYTGRYQHQDAIVQLPKMITRGT